MVSRSTSQDEASVTFYIRGGSGQSPEAFLRKILFTVVTLSAGFKGGEVVPSFFVGATFGCVAGPLLGLPAGLSRPRR